MKNIILKNWINPDNLLFIQKEGTPYYDKTTNKWKQQKGFKSTSRTVRQKGINHPHFKRVAYSKHTPYYNHIVIDADSGAAEITAQCKTLFTLCGISPLYITGTDNPDKPADSASILIFFKPLEKTPASKTLLTYTIRLFNLFSGGDLRNVGYQHKNPWLDYITVTWPHGEPQKENLPTLEYIYTQSCKYWNIPPQQVNDIYLQKVKISYDQSLQNLIASDPNPSPQKVKAYWYSSSRLPQLHEKIQPYLNLRPLHEWIIIYRLCKFYLNPQYFPQRFPFSGEYFDNFTSTQWIEKQVSKQHSISAGEFQQQAENLKIEGFNLFKITEKYLDFLGFDTREADYMIGKRNHLCQKSRERRSEKRRSDLGKKHEFLQFAANIQKVGMKYNMRYFDRQQRSDKGQKHKNHKEHDYLYNGVPFAKSTLIRLLKLENCKNISRKFKELNIVRAKNETVTV